MRYHDIIVSVRQLVRKAPEWSPHNPKMDYAITAGVSSLSSRIERSSYYILERLDEPGWGIDGPEHDRKLARIELPDEIHVGEYVVGYNLILQGPYGQYAARDGNGKSVYIYCGAPIVGKTGEKEHVIDAAIASGLFASIPTKDGGRTEFPLRVASVSDMYSDAIPRNWEPVWEDISLPKLKRLRIMRGMTALSLAEKSGVSARQIQRVELGEAEAGNLTAKNLLALADALGVDPRALL